MLLTEEMPKHDSPTESDLAVSRRDAIADLAGLRDEWNQLASDNPFHRWEWLEAWWQNFGNTNDELFILCVRDSDDRLIGLAPWYIENSAVEGRVVRFLGSGRVCSDYLTILGNAEESRQVAERIADWMVDEAGDAWDAIDFDGIAADDVAIDAFLGRLASHNLTMSKSDGLNCWRIALPDSWDAYLKCLSKSRRERVRQLHRRQFDTGRAVIHRAETAADLTRGFDVLVELHQLRRNSLGEPGCFADPAFESFLREVADRFLELGRLRLQWVELEERPIAVQIDLAGGDTVYHYQSGIDPAMEKERPGWLGTSAALKWALDEGYAHFDFLRGDETYKSHWRGEPVATFDARVAGHSLSSRLRHEMWSIQRKLKKWVKSRFWPA